MNSLLTGGLLYASREMLSQVAVSEISEPIQRDYGETLVRRYNSC